MMRDVLIENIMKRMESDEKILFVSADFGSPKLDQLREKFDNRFYNVGIAEQNAMNVSLGLALEGYTIFVYGIDAFITTRAYEQIKNIAMLSQIDGININIIGVGAGLSYDMIGVTHHSLESLDIISILPNMTVFNPCDDYTTKYLADYCIDNVGAKYLRLDGKQLPDIKNEVDLFKGFRVLREGGDVCFVSTGYMTHKALRVANIINADVIDLFKYKPINRSAFNSAIRSYHNVYSLKEGFTYSIFQDDSLFRNKYIYNSGDREYLHELIGLSDEDIIRKVK